MGRSEAIDQIVSAYLKQPVEVRWEGGLASPLTGTFRGAEMRLQGVATAWLSLERVALRAGETRILPGLPAQLDVRDPSFEITIGQRDLDRWLGRFEMPFRLHLEDHGLVVKTELAGIRLAAFEAKLDVVGGWFMLRPVRTSILDVPQSIATLLQSYLPAPPLADQVRLANVEHGPARLKLRFEVADFVEEITPGIVDRVRRRILPFGR